MLRELDDDHVAAICRVLIEHEVRFVVIGGVAARLHDTGHATVDVDVCPSTDEDNLVRLAAALRHVVTMTLITNDGPLDLCFQPAGFRDGYDALVGGSTTVVVAAVDVPVASLADVVASKRAAGRPKDIVALPALEARLREQ